MLKKVYNHNDFIYYVIYKNYYRKVFKIIILKYKNKIFIIYLIFILSFLKIIIYLRKESKSFF